MSDPTVLPSSLPAPVDDGAARHLLGVRLPPLQLPSTDGGHLDLGALGDGRTILYIYPMTATPGRALPHGWDALPGARGCTPQACSMRDHLGEIRAVGAARVIGLSGQSPKAQVEAHERLHLPFPLVSDQQGRAAAAPAVLYGPRDNPRCAPGSAWLRPSQHLVQKGHQAAQGSSHGQQGRGSHDGGRVGGGILLGDQRVERLRCRVAACDLAQQR